MGTEAALQAKCTAYLRAHKIYYKKIVIANTAGTPDIFACINGRFIAFELKAPKGKPTELQLHNQRTIRANGGECHIVTDYNDFIHIVNQHRSQHERTT